MERAITATKSAWFGPTYLEAGWAPAPRYLMRRARILHHLNGLPPGNLVEIGSASGALLSELSARGFQCTGLESSQRALDLARQVNTDAQFRVEPDDQWSECYDYCLSFEVLEHIENDGLALTQWAKWLRPGGTMLLSVPAHPKLWNARDIWAGHFRRYRRRDLERVFEEAGLIVETIECYGFPLANILEMIIAPSYRKHIENDGAKTPKLIKRNKQRRAALNAQQM